MKRRNAFSIGLIVLLSTSLMSGCWNRPFISSDTEGFKLSNELLGYLENDDAEGVKSMLCVITKSDTDTDNEIVIALEFFEGEVTSRDRELTASEESVTNGEIEYLTVRPYIKNVKTDSNRTYNIKFYAQLVNIDNPDKVGISKIIITDEGGNECVIGEYLGRKE